MVMSQRKVYILPSKRSMQLQKCFYNYLQAVYSAVLSGFPLQLRKVDNQTYNIMATLDYQNVCLLAMQNLAKLVKGFRAMLIKAPSWNLSA